MSVCLCVCVWVWVVYLSMLCVCGVCPSVCVCVCASILHVRVYFTIDKRERGIGNGSRDATQFAYVT